MRSHIEHRIPPSTVPRRGAQSARAHECDLAERGSQQLRDLKRASVGADIQTLQRRKDFGKPGF